MRATHHGQIKLALKAMGRPLDDEEIGAGDMACLV
jgi:hypothetical protein